jgi:hypothetical protein
VNSTGNCGKLDTAVYGNDPLMDKLARMSADNLATE